MAIIWIIIITLGAAIALISFILALKLSFSTAFKNPLFYSQMLSLIGLSGLIFYGTDFFDANHHQLSFTFEAGLPALLDSISKVLWPFLGFILLSWVAYQLLSILKNPGIYQGLAQTIWGSRNQQNASQNPIINRHFPCARNSWHDHTKFHRFLKNYFLQPSDTSGFDDLTAFRMPFFDNSRYPDALLPSISYCRCFPPVYTGTGLGRRSSIKARIFWNKIFDTATSANWNVT